LKSIRDPLIECDFENVYNPSEDTFLLIDYFKNKISNSYFDGINVNEVEFILDLGTGTGIIAIFFQCLKVICKNFNPKIYASDILEESILCAKKNEVLNDFHNEILFLQSNLFKSFPKSLKASFNIIVFNPPYLPSSPLITDMNNKKKIDFSWDGGIGGSKLLLDFFKEVRDFLNLKAHYIYFLSSSRTNLDELDKYIRNLGFRNEIVGRKHIFFEDIFINRLTSL
jgi:release factor glutamine methyltransferase